jgi:hypothetical protein
MTPRAICMIAAFATGLFVNAALALWLPAEIGFWKSLKPLTFESVSSTGTRVYAAKLGYGCVDLDFAALGPDGRTEFHSFHMRY